MKRKDIERISLRNMSFAFEGGAEIFKNITCDFPQHKAVWIRAPGGWGKSTLLRLLFGLKAPSQGQILFNDVDVASLSFEEFLPYRMAMGYGFDMGGLLNNKTLFENLALQLQYHRLLDREAVRQRVTEVMEEFGVLAKAHQRPHAVSGSVRKLTCLLRAFMHHPQVVFLDDPLTGLNEDNVRDLVHFIDQSFARRGLKQVFFTSENPILGEAFQADELLISNDWFTLRAA